MKIIVIGCGTIGKTVIGHISKERHNTIIIDNDKDVVEKLIEKYDVMGVVGNGASLEIQEEANVKNADLVIAVSSDDEINILACLVAKKLGAKSTIARVRNPEYRRQSVLMKDELGLSMIVNPEEETANEITNMINLPTISRIEHFAKGLVNLVEIVIEKDNPLINETLISMNKKLNTKVLICAVERKNEVIIPSGNFKLQEGDRINFTAESSSLRSFLRELNLIKSPLKKVMIIGGGKTGYYLANNLSKSRYKVRLIEVNKDKANDLAEKLPNVSVIYADGTKHGILLEEGIETTDAFVALTNVDEENIIVSLFANKLNVRKVITKIKRDTLLGMTDDLGIENIVMPKEVVANKIVSYVRAIANKRGSNVMTLYRLVDNQVEALEFLAKKREKFYNKPLKDLRVKENCLIACIIREGVVIIPNGNDYIQLNDSVIVVTTHKNFDDLADAFE